MELSNEYQSMVANSICHSSSMAAEEWRAAATYHSTPSAVWKPRLFIDGNQWCALYGDNLQDGVAGFGDSPSAAMWDFDKAWNTNLKPSNV